MPFDVAQIPLDGGAVLGQLLRLRYVEALQVAYGDAGRTLEMDLAFNLENPLIQNVLGDLAGQVRAVADTTRDEIRALVGRQAEEGWSVAQLAEEIEALGEIHSRERALMIARTESAQAYTQGSLLAYEQSGVVEGIEWLVTEPCEICEPNAGQVRPLRDGEPFPSGHAAPPAHPRCRCAVIPVVRRE